MLSIIILICEKTVMAECPFSLGNIVFMAKIEERKIWAIYGGFKRKI